MEEESVALVARDDNEEVLTMDAEYNELLEAEGRRPAPLI
jgi:hypothetical protein